MSSLSERVAAAKAAETGVDDGSPEDAVAQELDDAVGAHGAVG